MARIPLPPAVRGRLSAGLRARGRGRVLSQALAVRDPSAYLRAERAATGAPTAHVVRDGGVHVVLRHGTTDTRMFDEIFCARVYAPPPPVAAAVDALGRPPRVLDLGGNVGLFAAHAVARWPGAEVTVVEPDPANLDVLRRCAALNAPAGSWTVVEAAASTSTDPLRFVAGAGSESHQAHPAELDASIEVPAVDALGLLASADLLKMDIEGGEWAILADPRLADVPVRALVLEHHGRLCPTRDPRATARELLSAAGFATLPGGAETLGVGTLWAWRPPGR